MLRLLGMSEARWLADRLHQWGVLETGGAHWLAGAMIRLRAAAPASVTPKLLQDLAPADLAVPVEVAPEVLKHAVRGACRTLEARRRARDERLALLPAGPGRRVFEVALEADLTWLRPTDMVLLVCPAGTQPTESALRHARAQVNAAGARAGHTVRLGLLGPATDAAYTSVLAALTGLDAVVLADAGPTEAHFARRICAQAGVMVLDAAAGAVGAAAAAAVAANTVADELAGALVAEQLAALAGLPPTSWGWVPGQATHQSVLASLFPAAFIARTGSGVAQDETCSVPHADALSQAIARLESWPLPTIDPASRVNKGPGYWNPFA